MKMPGDWHFQLIDQMDIGILLKRFQKTISNTLDCLCPALAGHFLFQHVYGAFWRIYSQFMDTAVSMASAAGIGILTAAAVTYFIGFDQDEAHV